MAPDRETELDTVRDEYEKHALAYPTTALEAALVRIKAKAGWADTTSGAAEEVALRLGAAIRDERPFCMIRVGDGTGNLLGYQEPEFSHLRNHAVARILQMTFGTTDFSAHDIDQIANGIIDGIRSADILGVSDDVRLERMRDIDSEAGFGRDIRGFSGSRESYIAIDRLLERQGVNPTAIVSNHMHRYLAPHMVGVLSGVGRLCVIGPYDLGDAITRRFGVETVHTILIPNQADTSRQGSKWYPRAFSEVVAEIDPARYGQVHLVAAGLLAKKMCSEIKARGGIAIDVGSLIDVWAGVGVRRYHDDAFIEANALPGNGSSDSVKVQPVS